VIEVEQVDANLESEAGVTTTKQIKMDTIEEAGENEDEHPEDDGDEGLGHTGELNTQTVQIVSGEIKTRKQTTEDRD